MYIILNVFTLTLLLSYVSGFALPFEGLQRLDIIHYNDFHARYEETSVETATCKTNDSFCIGGFPRLYHHIQTLLKEKPNSILLNAGDSFQGTYWYTLLKWNITQEFMNMLPHDAHAIGNHEFDDGPEGLVPYLRALKSPVVVANMDSSKFPDMEGLYVPHIIVERNRRKIGIIGLITTDTAILSSPGNVTFTDPFEATRREAEALTEKGVDIIILLSHCGINVDRELAKRHGNLIDIIVGGHTHSLLWNGESPSHEDVVGPYPIIIQPADDNLHKVLIVQASAFTKYMGNLFVYFDYKGDYVKWEGGPIFLNRSIPEDLEIKKKLEPYAKLVHEAENIPIGKNEAMLKFEDCVFGECTLGDLLVDAFAEYAKSLTKSSEDYLSFIQRGNMKSSIPAGDVTRGDIFELLPFNDRIYACEIQGKYILEALERSVSNAWAYNPFKGPWVLQVSGVRVTYNVTLPEGERVTSALVGEKPLDADKYYPVTMPAYLGDGGDGFTMFRDYKRNVVVVGRDEAVLEQYIKNHSPLNIQPDGRIVINEY